MRFLNLLIFQHKLHCLSLIRSLGQILLSRELALLLCWLNSTKEFFVVSSVEQGDLVNLNSLHNSTRDNQFDGQATTTTQPNE